MGKSNRNENKNKNKNRNKIFNGTKSNLKHICVTAEKVDPNINRDSFSVRNVSKFGQTLDCLNWCGDDLISFIENIECYTIKCSDELCKHYEAIWYKGKDPIDEAFDERDIFDTLFGLKVKKKRNQNNRIRVCICDNKRSPDSPDLSCIVNVFLYLINKRSKILGSKNAKNKNEFGSDFGSGSSSNYSRAIGPRDGSLFVSMIDFIDFEISVIDNKMTNLVEALLHGSKDYQHEKSKLIPILQCEKDMEYDIEQKMVQVNVSKFTDQELGVVYCNVFDWFKRILESKKVGSDIDGSGICRTLRLVIQREYDGNGISTKITVLSF